MFGESIQNEVLKLLFLRSHLLCISESSTTKLDPKLLISVPTNIEKIINGTIVFPVRESWNVPILSQYRES